MRNIRIRRTAPLTLAELISLAVCAFAFRALAAAPVASVVQGQQDAAGQQAGAEKKQPQWKSREEYDAFQAMAKETDAHKRISLAEGVLQKYPNSDFKDAAYVVEMGGYQQLGDSAKAIDGGRKALQANPDNLDALTYLGFAFPFVYKATDANKDAELSQAENDGKRGLDLLQKLQKPANVSDEQFTAYVKPKRAIFNNVVGFVALQRKDYAAAITSLKAATEDNPSESLTFSLLGQSYLYSTPPDFNNAIWNLARSVALAKAANNPNAAALQKFYDQVYVSRHGSDQGEKDIVTQAESSIAAPQGFDVPPPPKHKPTGNPSVDGLYQIEDALRVGGDQADKNWQSLKGQPLQLAGFVDGIEKGSDPGTYLVRVDITPESKAKEGVYDIELKDSQAAAKDLSKGDPVRFQGAISAYTVTPSFVLTLDNGKINEEDLAAATAEKEKKKKPKTAPRHRTHRTQQ